MENKRKEIDSRVTPELEVTAWLIVEQNLVILSLVDIVKNRAVEFVVEPDKVADALMHPWAYIEQSGTELVSLGDEAS